MPVDHEQRVDYKVVAQEGADLTVEYTMGEIKLLFRVPWDGVVDLDELLRDIAPIGEFRRRMQPLPERPHVVGRHGRIVMIVVPDSD